MPKLLSQFFADEAAKLGIKSDDPAFIKLMAIKELASITIDDDVVSLLDSNIHSLASARAQLKSTLHAEALNGVDAELERTMSELGIDDAVQSVLKAEKSTSKRASMLAKKIKELESDKAKATPADRKDLQDEINKLKQEKADLAKAKDAEKTSQAESYETRITELVYENMLNDFDYAIPKGLEKKDIMAIAKIRLNEAMAANGLRTISENGRLKLVTIKDGTEYFDKTNTKKDLESFTGSTLAQHNLLKTSDTGNPGDGNPTPPVLPGSSSADKSSAQFLSSLDQQIAELTGQQ